LNGILEIEEKRQMDKIKINLYDLESIFTKNNTNFDNSCAYFYSMT